MLSYGDGGPHDRLKTQSINLASIESATFMLLALVMLNSPINKRSIFCCTLTIPHSDILVPEMI